jgi:hypothetical protein
LLANGGWDLTLILLTSTKWWTPAIASKWRMGFNSAFKGLMESNYNCVFFRNERPCSLANRVTLKKAIDTQSCMKLTSKNTIRFTKIKLFRKKKKSRMSCEERVACIRENRNAYRISVWKTERTRIFVKI